MQYGEPWTVASRYRHVIWRGGTYINSSTATSQPPQQRAPVQSPAEHRASQYIYTSPPSAYLPLAFLSLYGSPNDPLAPFNHSFRCASQKSQREAVFRARSQSDGRALNSR
ncbi:hypothetical protein DPSP01_005822 [Paraphaeosphaeria sporulosa]